MPSVGELTAVYGNFMLNPGPGPSTCRTCFTFTDGYDRCYPCEHTNGALDAMAPISYSVANGQLHHALASYKRHTGDGARRLRAELAAVLWRFLERHEQCVARATKTATFELVTTVPSGDQARDKHHPLHKIVGHTVGPTRDRYHRLLERAASHVEPRTFDDRKFAPTRPLSGQSVLLIDDTWTTGTSAQSAAAALKRAGANRVAAVVIGRHLNRDWHENDQRLRRLSRPFDWSRCALCDDSTQALTACLSRITS
jgi:predicted amidophosphoribosyltransferase